MSLRERRVLFTRLLVELVAWCNGQPGWEVALDEGRVLSPRAVWVDGKRRIAMDAVHKPRSFHHDGLAQDLLLYVNGNYVSDGDSSEYKRIAAKWESMHPLCTSGRRWHDSNHVSLGEGDRSDPLPA